MQASNKSITNILDGSQTKIVLCKYLRLDNINSQLASRQKPCFFPLLFELCTCVIKAKIGISIKLEKLKRYSHGVF